MDDPLLLLEGRIMVSGRCVDCYYPAAVVDIMMSSSNPYHICRQCSRLHVLPPTGELPQRGGSQRPRGGRRPRARCGSKRVNGPWGTVEGLQEIHRGKLHLAGVDGGHQIDLNGQRSDAKPQELLVDVLSLHFIRF